MEKNKKEKKNNKIDKLWGNRLGKGYSPVAEAFTSGRDVRGKPPADNQLVPYDLWGSRAHAVMLSQERIIPREIGRRIIKGLREIEALWRKGEFELDPKKEDVHSNFESFLIKKYGMEIGGRLHTARSRNDQIALDMRLFLRDRCVDFVSAIGSLIEGLMEKAKGDQDVVMPGYTHHQPAQVTTFGHTWLAFAEAMVRDAQRFEDWFSRFNQNPLGSMTGYSTSFGIDQRLTSRLLGFAEPCENSLDPIQNRWEAEAEFAFAITLMMNHLSAMAQTLILFSTEEFGMIRLDDAFCSGSSMMPQKRNPDALEIIKAKAALAQGQVVSLTSIGRSLFLGYNRDTQWTKYLIMDLIDESLPAIRLMGYIISSLDILKDKAAALASRGFIGAPDLVERLVQQWGLPFRQAKLVMEKAVKFSEAEGLGSVSLKAMQRGLKEEGLGLKIGPEFIIKGQEPKVLVSRRKAIGGQSSSSLNRNIQSLQKRILEIKQWVWKKRREEESAKDRLAAMENKI